MKTSICSGWEYTPEWSEEFLAGEEPFWPVELPHNPVELPLHCIDHEDYQLLCGYRRKLTITREQKQKRLFLRFDGAAHIATVYVNGSIAGTHACGYTAFTLEITGLVWEGENTIAVQLDTTENPQVPPFGFVIDYLTYGGLYREAWLVEKPMGYIKDVFVTTPTVNSARVEIEAVDFTGEFKVELYNSDGGLVWENTGRKTKLEAKELAVKPWSPEAPNLCRCVVKAMEDGRETDREEVVFGFRTARFQADGFYLNGEKVFLRGLNRHQSFPYMGYAATASLQREDARILKQELRCNAVRTSHYPQSRHFLDACDRLGLLVFTEIPGWQHIGDEAWKQQACRNTEEMVLQYRNHPSIILWGVRINESVDDNKFYKQTNRIAHKLDPSRATSGVRYLEKSSLLEDVYAFNDFSHTGENPGARPKNKVTPNRKKAFLISECNGHMFPTKAFDPWEKRQEHALRHIRVQNAAYESGVHAGCFGWCMFDYPTHKDFGSGDRICYHGVMDAFRNPKLAAAAYSSQGQGGYVLEVGSSMDIGDYPGGQIGDVYVFSNADEVELYKNDVYVTKLSRSREKGLPHPPFLLDDTIGQLLETQEGFDPKKAKRLRECLIAAGKYGLSLLPLKYKLKLLWCMVRYRMKFEDGVKLYGKYVGNWGGEATRWRFDAKVGERVVASVTKCPSAALHLEAVPSATRLVRGDTYDSAAVRITLRDEFGNLMPYAQLPVKLELQGEARLIGPDVVTAEGGMCGTYLRTAGEEGTAVLRISAANLEPVEITFTIE